MASGGSDNCINYLRRQRDRFTSVLFSLPPIEKLEKTAPLMTPDVQRHVLSEARRKQTSCDACFPGRLQVKLDNGTVSDLHVMPDYFVTAWQNQHRSHRSFELCQQTGCTGLSTPDVMKTTAMALTMANTCCEAKVITALHPFGQPEVIRCEHDHLGFDTRALSASLTQKLQ